LTKSTHVCRSFGLVIVQVTVLPKMIQSANRTASNLRLAGCSSFLSCLIRPWLLLVAYAHADVVPCFRYAKPVWEHFEEATIGGKGIKVDAYECCSDHPQQSTFFPI
jgi:hypothetical protein